MASTKRKTLEPQSAPLPPLPPPTDTSQTIRHNNDQQQISFESVSNYEQTREQKFKENRESLQKIGVVDLSLQLNTLVSTKRTRRRNFDRKTPIKPLPSASADPHLRSSRLQNAPPVTYTEPKEAKSRRSRDFVLEEGAKPEVYTEEHEKMLGDTEMPWTFFVDGYRADGTRIYDPINGKTCHQCRQKTLGLRTFCCKCKVVRGQFCGECLMMRYGEHVVEANQNPNWVCPPCRGICNCSLCREAKGWTKTGAIYKRIKSLGFKSVAHYLITTKRAPPDSENCSDAPPSANPQPEKGYTTALKSALKPADDVGRSRDKSTKENAVAGSESVRASDETVPKPRGVGRSQRSLKKENIDTSQESGRASDELISKPRCVGRPRNSSKKEKTDAGEESARRSDESVPKPRSVVRPRKSSKKDKTEDGEESVLAIDDSVPKPSSIGRPRKRLKKENTDAGEESARASDESVSKPRSVGRPWMNSKKENTDAGEDSARACDESIPKRSCVGISQKSSKKGKTVAGEESVLAIDAGFCNGGDVGASEDSGGGSMNEDGGNVLKFRIPDAFNKDADIKILAKDSIQEACLLFKRDIDVVIHTYMERLCIANKQNDDEEGVVFVQHQIFQDNDWSSSINALVEQVIQKTNAAKSLDLDVGGQSTPMQMQAKPVMVNIPSALKEYCSINLGPCGVDVPYVSQFMIMNKEIFKDLHTLEKELLDYCFLEETMDKFENIFSYGDFYALSREDALTLKNNEKISTIVFDCWVVYLNMIERNQDVVMPDKDLKAFLFASQHCRALGMLMAEKDDVKANDLKSEVVDSWKNHVNFIGANSEIKKINMFFVPVTSVEQQHHVLVVVDTQRKSIHYLDNIRRQKDFKDAGLLHKFVVGCFFDFLDAFNHASVEEVRNYKLNIVKLPWTVNDANDCGVYVAYFMEQFMGDHNLSPLHAAEDILKYRGLICSRLVLSDVNKNREEVLKKLDAFNKEKESKFQLIIAERELKVVEKQKQAEEESNKPFKTKKTSRNKLVSMKII